MLIPMKPAELISREQFLSDRHGKTFADVLDDPDTPFDAVLEFFNDAGRQQRMEDSEIHHDRAALAGVVRELESLAALHRYLFSTSDRRRSARLRQAIGVLVRMIMERRGWRTTGKKGSLGVRGSTDSQAVHHNTGGLSLWFLRAERYQSESGKPYRSVRERCQELEGTDRADPAVQAPASGDGESSPHREGDASLSIAPGAILATKSIVRLAQETQKVGRTPTRRSAC
jgi:hypothetical protein